MPTGFFIFGPAHDETRNADFQYKKTRLEATELIKRSKDKLEAGGLIYIATDERDKTFFDPFREHYDIVFLDDFKHVLKGINENYYGMLDQLVASKGTVFFGTFFSTLSGYVNRMRGYYIAKHKLDGCEDGTMESYYFIPVSEFVLFSLIDVILHPRIDFVFIELCSFRVNTNCWMCVCSQDDKVNQMRQYMPVKLPIYMREFPISWRDIDKGIEELHMGFPFRNNTLDLNQS